VVAADPDLDRPSAFPLIAVVAVVLLVVVGAFTILGWVFGLIWGLIRLAILAVVVLGLIAGVRWFVSRR
jgi:hypothetical protein